MRNLESYLKYGIYIGLFAVLFVPLIVADSLFFPFITGKAFAFRLIIELVFGAWLVLAFLDKNYRPKISAFTITIGILLVTLGISTLISENPFKSFWSNFERMEGYITILHLAGYFLVLGSVFTNKIWNRFWQTSLGVSLYISLYAVFQLLGFVVINQGGVRVDGTFGNATYLAVYTLFHIFIAGWLFVRAKSLWAKWIYVLIIILHSVILFFTATRGAILGLFAGLLVTAFLFAVFGKGQGKKRFVAIGAIFAVALIVGTFFATKNLEFVRSHPVLGRFSTISVSEATVESRFMVWEMAWKGFKERPIFGWGQESFNYVFNKHYAPEMHRYEAWFDRTHNIFLDWLIAGGLFAFLAYSVLYLLALYTIWKTNDFSFSEKTILSGLMVAYVFHNIFVFDNIGSYILFFALLARLHHASAPRSLPPLEKEFSKEIVLYYVAPTVLVLTIICVWFVNVPAYQANKSLLQAVNINETVDPQYNIEQFKKSLSYNSFGKTEAREHLIYNTTRITSSLVGQENKSEFFNFAINEFKKQIEETPNDARSVLLLGSVFSQNGFFEESIKFLERAKELSPRKQIIALQLGSVYLEMKDYDKASEFFEEVVSNTPGPIVGSKLDAKLAQISLAIIRKDSEAEKNILQEIGISNKYTSDRLFRTYVSVKRYGDIVEILKQRSSLYPADPQIKLSLAGAYLWNNQKNEALLVLEEIKKTFPKLAPQVDYYISEIKAGRNPTE